MEILKGHLQGKKVSKCTSVGSKCAQETLACFELPWGKIDIHKPDNGRLEVCLAFANIFIKVSGFFLQMSF